jgi:hypothetical protein
MPKKNNINGNHNNIVDAFRHAIWNALNARDLGDKKAKKFGDAHEAMTDQPDAEREMDLHNNEMGRKIGTSESNKSEEAMVKDIENAIVNGNLIIFAPDDGPKSYKYGKGVEGE